MMAQGLPMRPLTGRFRRQMTARHFPKDLSRLALVQQFRLQLALRSRLRIPVRFRPQRQAQHRQQCISGTRTLSSQLEDCLGSNLAASK